jgi:hypothetical protein
MPRTFPIRGEIVEEMRGESKTRKRRIQWSRKIGREGGTYKTQRDSIWVSTDSWESCCTAHWTEGTLLTYSDRTLFTSSAGLEQAKSLIVDYKKGKLAEMTPELWTAKKTIDSTLHPGSYNHS